MKHYFSHFTGLTGEGSLFRGGQEKFKPSFCCYIIDLFFDTPHHCTYWLLSKYFRQICACFCYKLFVYILKLYTYYRTVDLLLLSFIQYKRYHNLDGILLPVPYSTVYKIFVNRFVGINLCLNFLLDYKLHTSFTHPRT